MNDLKHSNFSVIITFVLMMIIGAALIPLLNIQFTPSKTLQDITVRYYWANASARVMEENVTGKLEGVFGKIKGIKEIKSVSKKGEGEVTLSFKKETDLDMLRFEIATLIRVLYHSLPEGVSYPELSLDTSGGKVSPILVYSINSSANAAVIQKYAEDHIHPVLARVQGVSSIDIYGAALYEWEVKFDAEKCALLNISGDEIASGINQFFQKPVYSLGYDKQQKDQPISKIRIKLTTLKPEEVDWSRIPISNKEGHITYLTDVARVKYREQTPDNYFRVNGLNNINMVVYPDEGVNTIRLAEKVKEVVAEIRKDLPLGYAVNQTQDSTEYLKKQLNTILLRTVFSIGVLLVFVLITSRSFRYLWWIFSSLVANILVAFIFYYFTGLEIHLYSLAGITISLGIIIDNSIVMIDHIKYHSNKKAFPAVFAATLTTIASVLIVFLLKESQQVNLIDFAQVVAINLSVSLVVAYFFTPAIMGNRRQKGRRNKVYYKRKRRVIKFSAIYERVILLGIRSRWIFIIVFILSFGVPTYWLPEYLDTENETEESFWVVTYNSTIGSDWYNNNVRETLDLVVGGSFRLFTAYVYNSSFYSDPQRTTLYVIGSMPEGCTVHQLNEVMTKMENFLSQFDEIESFQTQVWNYQYGSIKIVFKASADKTAFPFILKSKISRKSISLGGLEWSVYGIGKGFHTGMNGQKFKNSNITLEGYNYEVLYKIAEAFKDSLLVNKRIKEVDIKGSVSDQPIHEYFIRFNQEALGLNDISMSWVYTDIKQQVYRTSIAPIFHQNISAPVVLVSSNADHHNTWDMKHNIMEGDHGKGIQFQTLAKVEKRNTGNNIYKSNQQYELVLAYDYIGSNKLSQKVLDKFVKKFNAELPLGYHAKESMGFWSWNKEDNTQYYLLFLVVGIIYFICSIFLESLRQPFGIIMLIPISFIGVFLTFYLFDINFDQGGLASFILLSGIVVNAALYITNDYNNYLKYSRKPSVKSYLKAYNSKIMPIVLTILSTVIGLIPFIWMGQTEVFWFAFAAGTIGGLLFSLIAIIIYLPLFFMKKEGK